MKKLKIFTFAESKPEYLQLQIDSFNKYMKSDDVEFIVVNSALTEIKVNKINDICFQNNIQCIKYTGSYNGYNTYYMEQYNWFRDNIQKQISDYIMMIHHDMFFINWFDFRQKFKENTKIHMVYQCRSPNTDPGVVDYLYEYFWDGVLLFDSEYFNNENLTEVFVWNAVRPLSKSGGSTDMGGMLNKLYKK